MSSRCQQLVSRALAASRCFEVPQGYLSIALLASARSRAGSARALREPLARSARFVADLTTLLPILRDTQPVVGRRRASRAKRSPYRLWDHVEHVQDLLEDNVRLVDLVGRERRRYPDDEHARLAGGLDAAGGVLDG